MKFKTGVKKKMITADKLELGQMMFGNPVGEYECPDYVESLISSLFDEIDRVYWNVNQKDYIQSYKY